MSLMEGLGLLENVGIAGRDQLRDALTTCEDPIAAIEEFQEQNGIQLLSLKPALHFLDLHGVMRYDFHGSVMEELRDCLIKRVQELAESSDKTKMKALNDLLQKSFPMIKVKALRPVVMSVMKHMPKIKQEYLNKIIDDNELYKEAPIEVKQQIWQDNQVMFGDEVSPLLQKYITDKESSLINVEVSSAQSFFSLTPKARRQNDVVQQLTKMVGKNVRLYDMVLQFLRTLFLRTRIPHYCTLRAEILMALHDLEVHDICQLDPCHKFTWCLDACIRERFVDSKRARELQGFLDGIRRGQEQVLGDLSMILCDPYAMNTIAISAMKALQHCANTETLPRQNEELMLLLRMLALGLNAWQIIDSQVFKEPKLDVVLITRFLPTVLSLMMDDNIASVAAKIPEEASNQLEAIPLDIYPFCQDAGVPVTVFIYYCLQVARQSHAASVCRALPVLSNCDNDSVLQDTILHVLVSALIGMGEHFQSADFVNIVFDQFLLPNTSSENVLMHTLRLLHWVHARISPVRLSQLMKELQPNNTHSPQAVAAYKQLEEKITTRQPSPAHEPDMVHMELTSPLANVPAPTPAHP